MLKIRLQRVGRKHEPIFRLVLTDSKNSTKSGKFLEILGNYDSRNGESAVFKTDRISHWLNFGAQASDTAHNLLVSRKLIEGKKRNALPKKQPIVKEGAEVKAEVKAAPAPVTPTPVEAAPVVEETPAPEVVVEVATEAAPEEPVAETPSEKVEEVA